MTHIQENIIRFYSKFNELRLEEKYTDVILQCEDKSFKCHRLVLTVASSYFEAMFNQSFTESIVENIVLQEVSAATFEEVLHFIYTGDVVVNATNIYDLLRVSDYYNLPGIEDLCLKFVTNNKHQMKIRDLFPLFSYMCDTKRDNFVSVLSKLIAEHFNMCCKLDEFLELSFDYLQIILVQYLSLQSRNEELLVTAITRWTSHRREERFEHLDAFLGMIRFESVSPAFSKLMTKMLIAEKNPVTALKRPAGWDTDVEFHKDKILKIANGLHVYVKYEEENLIRIFSINSANECSNSDVISITDKATRVRCAVSDELYLYCLKYFESCNENREKQTFCAYTSVDRRGTVTLTPPPLLFTCVSLSYLQNNIYAYNERVTRDSVVRTTSESCKMFNDDELNRGIFVYNCSSDNWFPVPPMKQVVRNSCMTVCENTLYLIGGSEIPRKFPNVGFAQAFDCRAGWRTLPNSHNKYYRASCCSFNGKIYVCGGNKRKSAERYDPIANKWEIIQYVNNRQALHRMIPFDNKLWVMGGCNIDQVKNNTPSNNLSMDVYNVALNQWSKSTVLTNAAATLFSGPHTILDGVVFSIL